MASPNISYQNISPPTPLETTGGGRSRTMVGANVILYVNGMPYGQCLGFRFKSSTPRFAIYEIDKLDPSELATTITKSVGTVSIVKTVADNGIEGSGFTTSFQKLPREKYFSIVLINRLNGKSLFRSDYCSVTDQSWEFAAKNIVTGTLEFETLDWTNEAI